MTCGVPQYVLHACKQLFLNLLARVIGVSGIGDGSAIGIGVSGLVQSVAVLVLVMDLEPAALSVLVLWSAPQ